VKRAGILLLLLLSSGALLAQQIYRWTDEKGRVHVTDTPPPPNAKEVQRRAPGRGSDAGAPEPYALQLARQKNPVTLYTTPSCEACGEARKLLNARGVPFREVSVNDEKSLEELKKAVGSNSVPALVVGESVQKGFEEGAYQRALDAAGYPRTGMLPPRSQTEPNAGQPATESKPPAEEAPRGPYGPRSQ
jgi:glutaredoxin